LKFELNRYPEGLKSPEGYPTIKVKYELFNTLIYGVKPTMNTEQGLDFIKSINSSFFPLQKGIKKDLFLCELCVLCGKNLIQEGNNG